MVRNTTGGTKTKGLARKHMNKSNQSHKLRVPEEEGEELACVTKMFGNGMCQIITNENEELIGHIRGCMRGRQKRHNTITINAIVLIGLRTWESTKKNCDILCIYNDNEVKQLLDIPTIKMNNLNNSRHSKMGLTEHELAIEFSNTIVEENKELENIIKTEHFDMDFKKDEIDIDDI